MHRTLADALDAASRRLFRYTNNGKDAPAELWRRHDVLTRALALADFKTGDKQIRKYLADAGVEL
jgi:hypothetical protein